MASTSSIRTAFAVIAQRLRHGVPTEEMRSPWDRGALPIYALIGLNFVVGMILVWATGINIGRDYWLTFLSWPALAVLSAWLIRRVGHARLASTLELLGLVYGQGLVAFLVVIPAIAVSLPFADGLLSQLDFAIRFDWPAYEAATRGYLSVFLFAYRSFTWQPAFVVLALVAARRDERAWRFVTAAGVALAITAIMFPFAPALGPFHHYGVVPSNDISEHWTNEVGPLFEQLKRGTLRHVGGNLVTGLVSFPSYHAAAGLLFVWALWPLRWLKWPILVFNLLMLASALTIGSHYLIDLVVGLVVGLLSIPIARRLQSRFSPAALRNPVVSQTFT